MLFKKKKVYVDKCEIQSILQKFVNDVKPKTFIHIDVKDNGDVILHTNRPGVLIGRQGRDFEMLKIEIMKCGAKHVHIKEIMYVASNCKFYYEMWSV